MLLLLLFTSLSLALVVILFWILRPHRNAPPSLQPFASPWSLVASGRKASQDIFRFLASSRDGNSPVFSLPVLSLSTGGTPVFATCDHRVARMVLPSQPSKPRWAYKISFEAIGGCNMFSSNGFRWKHARKGMAPALSLRAATDMGKSIDQILESWIKDTLEPQLALDKPIDILFEMQRISLKILAEALFKYTLSDEQVDGFIRSMDNFVRHHKLAATNPVRLLCPFLFKEGTEAAKATTYITNLGKEMMQSFKEANHPRGETTSAKNNQSVMSLIMDNENYTSDEERARDIFVLLVAGYDTTPATMAFIFQDLSEHQDEQTRLREDLQQNGISDSKYLRYVVKESTRLTPTAALGPSRTVEKDIIVENDYDDGYHHQRSEEKRPKYLIPKGSIVISFTLGINRNPRVFQDPDKFFPQRWANATKDMMDSNLAFASGPRNCIGQAMANKIIYSVVGSLVKNYSFGIADQGQRDNWFVLKPRQLLVHAKRVTE